MNKPDILLLIVNLMPQVLSDTNNTNFHDLSLERKDLRMLLIGQCCFIHLIFYFSIFLGQCEEFHQHQHDHKFYENFTVHPTNEKYGRCILIYTRNNYRGRGTQYKMF